MPIDMVPMCEDHEPFQKSPKSACEVCALRDMHADYRSLLMQVHSIFVLLKRELGHLGYGASRVALNVEQVCNGTFQHPKRNLKHIELVRCRRLSRFLKEHYSVDIHPSKLEMFFEGTYEQPPEQGQTKQGEYCICTGGLISMDCPFHTDKDPEVQQ